MIAMTVMYVQDSQQIDPEVETICTTSDMDVADEYGFDHYDYALMLIEEGLKVMEMTKQDQNGVFLPRLEREKDVC